jgi:hypothetical protein
MLAAAWQGFFAEKRGCAGILRQKMGRKCKIAEPF